MLVNGRFIKLVRHLNSPNLLPYNFNELRNDIKKDFDLFTRKLVRKEKLIKLYESEGSANPEFGWWYNKHIGEEFEVMSFTYYKGGRNYILRIGNYEQLREAMKEYDNISIHVKTPDYPESQIFIEHTNLDLRYIRMEKLRTLNFG